MQFSFDVKMFVTVHVEATDEATARALVDDRLPGLVEGSWSESRGKLFINSASTDGEHELTEIDGEDPDAQA